jgi:hypothetical protein
MSVLQTHPNSFFPFDVVGAKGEKEILDGSIYYLMARQDSPFPFPPGKNPVRVRGLTPFSFTFETLPGHFDPPGSTITFTTSMDRTGTVYLTQYGVARAESASHALVFSQAPRLAADAWIIQAEQLKSYVRTGRLPAPWPARF